MKNLVTGATGFVGSHIAEKLRAAGEEVTAFARESSDTIFLEGLGVEVRYGSVTDASSVWRAVKGMDRVYHAAALTEEWAPRKVSHEINVEGTANLLEAAMENHIERFFYVSSLAVMGFKNHYGTGVETDYAKPGDPYIDSKMEAEKLVWRFYRFGLAVTVLRPGFMYGPRDRRFMWRILEKLRTGGFIFVGDGKNKMNLNYAGNFADAVVLASRTEMSIGQAYNIANDDKSLDMEAFIFKVADLWGYRRPSRHIPVKAAKAATSIMEGTARLMHKKEPPLLTKTRIKFLCHNLEFDISKAKDELGFENRVDIDTGLAMTKEWMEANCAWDGPIEKNGTKKPRRLPYTYRDKMTVASEKYRGRVRHEIERLKDSDGGWEGVIRLSSVLGENGPGSDDFEIGQFASTDGQRLKYNKWKSKNAEHVLVYLNGLESHGGWFSEAAQALAKNKVAVYAFDRRGSGLNAGGTGSYRDWLADVDAVLETAKQEYPGAKAHLASICLGATVATAWAIDHPGQIDSLIFISPGMKVKVDPTPLDKLKAGLDMLPGLSFNVRSPIREDEMFTDSREALYYLYKDKLRTHSPRGRDFFQIRRMRSYVLENLHKVTTPSLVLLAEKDRVVDIVQTRRTVRKFGMIPEIREYAGCEHALLLGDSKDKMVSDIIGYLGRGGEYRISNIELRNIECRTEKC